MGNHCCADDELKNVHNVNDEEKNQKLSTRNQIRQLENLIIEKNANNNKNISSAATFSQESEETEIEAK